MHLARRTVSIIIATYIHAQFTLGMPGLLCMGFSVSVYVLIESTTTACENASYQEAKESYQSIFSQGYCMQGITNEPIILFMEMFVVLPW